MLRFHARWILPITTPPVRDGTVAVDRQGRIAYVGPRADAPPGADHELGEAVLLPGLVDAHTLLEQTGTEEAEEPADVAGAALRTARRGIAERLRLGVTTFGDTAARSAAPMQAMRELGVRGVAFQQVEGPALADRHAAFAALRATVEALRPGETPLVRLGVAPHSVHEVHEELLIDACAHALGAGLPISIRAAATDAELAFLREAEGPIADALRRRGVPVERRAYSPVHLLIELGVDIAAPILVHGVRLDATDVAFAAERGMPVVHCPLLDERHGITPVAELLAAGATVALGTGAVMAGAGRGVLAEAGAAVRLQRARPGGAHAISAGDALTMATLGGARTLGLGARVGALEVGREADLAAFPLGGATIPPGAADSLAALLLEELAHVPASLVCVAGRVLVRDGRVLDPHEIAPPSA